MKGLTPDLAFANGSAAVVAMPGLVTLRYDLRFGLSQKTAGTYHLVVHTSTRLTERPLMLGAEDFANGQCVPTPLHAAGFIGGDGTDATAETLTAVVCTPFGSPDTRVTVSDFAITVNAPHLLPELWQNDHLLAQQVQAAKRQLQRFGVAVRVSALFTGYGLGSVNFSLVRPVNLELVGT